MAIISKPISLPDASNQSDEQDTRHAAQERAHGAVIAKLQELENQARALCMEGQLFDQDPAWSSQETRHPVTNRSSSPAARLPTKPLRDHEVEAQSAACSSQALAVPPDQNLDLRKVETFLPSEDTPQSQVTKQGLAALLASHGPDIGRPECRMKPSFPLAAPKYVDKMQQLSSCSPAVALSSDETSIVEHTGGLDGAPHLDEASGDEVDEEPDIILFRGYLHPVIPAERNNGGPAAPSRTHDATDDRSIITDQRAARLLEQRACSQGVEDQGGNLDTASIITTLDEREEARVQESNLERPAHRTIERNVGQMGHTSSSESEIPVPLRQDSAFADEWREEYQRLVRRLMSAVERFQPVESTDRDVFTRDVRHAVHRFLGTVPSELPEDEASDIIGGYVDDGIPKNDRESSGSTTPTPRGSTRNRQQESHGAIQSTRPGRLQAESDSCAKQTLYTTSPRWGMTTQAGGGKESVTQLWTDRERSNEGWRYDQDIGQSVVVAKSLPLQTRSLGRQKNASRLVQRVSTSVGQGGQRRVAEEWLVHPPRS